MWDVALGRNGSEARAGAGVRLVGPRGDPLRYTWERDEQDVGRRPGVDDLIHFSGSFDERLSRAVRRCLALVADRSMYGERALLDDDDRAPWVRMPARGTARANRDLRHRDVRPGLERDRSV